MAYPFVKAFYDYGRRLGPTLAFVIHMAEGGGTVGYLSRASIRGVSVHYVIEYSGRIVQMLAESRVSGSINPNDIRTTNGPEPYGATVRKQVLGSWDRNPNHAIITVEIEGFARTGPNASQQAALMRLVADLRSRYPKIGLLGHRDFADYKACPGAHIPWDTLGGHGPAGGDVDVVPAPITDETPKLVTANEGHTWRDLDGKTVLDNDRPALVARISPYGVTAGTTKLRAIYATVQDVRRIVLIVPATEVPVPVPDGGEDCTDEVQAAVNADRAGARIVWD